MLKPKRFSPTAKDDSSKQPACTTGGHENRPGVAAGLPPELSEVEVNSLYNVARVIDLEPKEFLFRKGEPNRNFYLVLDGEMAAVRYEPDAAKPPTIARKGDWLGLTGLAQNACSASTIVARTKSRLMALDRDAVEGLDEQMRLSLYRRLINVSATRIADLEIEEDTTLVRNGRLIETLFDQQSQDKSDYQKSKLITNVLEKIPNLPAYIGNLSARLEDEEVDAAEIAKLIKHDPSLAANILKTLNSPLYGLQQKISDVSSAIMYLGFQALQQLIVSETIKRTMPKTSNFQTLHIDAVSVSHLAFVLSRAHHIEVPVQMSTVGLLHNIGKSVIELLKSNNKSFAMFIDFIDQAQIGSLLLEKWNLPEEIWRAVELQSLPEFAPPYKLPEADRKRVALLFVTKTCYRRIRNPDPAAVDPVFFADYARILWAEHHCVDDIIKHIVRSELKKKNNEVPGFLKKLVANYR